MTTVDSQLSIWTEKKLQSSSQSQTCTRKGSLWSAAGLIHYSFLNPDESITSEKYAQQIDEMHQKLQCLQLALVNRKGPILLHDNSRPLIAQPMLQKMNQLGYEVLPHLPYPPDHSPTITSSSISTTFCKENASTTSRMQKTLSKSSLNLKARIFTPQEKTNLFLIGKNVFIVMVSILINKNVFETSQNGLKSRVCNHNYFCTNLIF